MNPPSLFLLIALALLQSGERAGKKRPQLDRAAGDPLPTSEFSKAEALLTQRLLGECVVKRHPNLAAEYVLLPPTEVNIKKRDRLIERMDLGGCLDNVVVEGQSDLLMTLPGQTLRYALAEPLVRATFGSAPTLEFKNVPQLVHPPFIETDFNRKPQATPKERKLLEARKSAHLGAIFLSAFGECVVRTDPANSFALIMTVPGSQEDKARMKALSDALAGCLPTGRQLSFERQLIRGTIANNYFRLATAARATQPLAGAPR